MNKSAFGTPEQKGNVTIYPAAPAEKLRVARGEGKTKVAAYVRVSTDSAQQEGSLVLQREYFENLIKNNPEYEFVEIYEDDGVTATSVEKRKGFLKMMEDCKAGKIDLILTKSISRFARNTGDLLSYVNMLNSLSPPVEIYFEVERASTFGASGELLLTVLGMCAQEESRAKSESVTWAIDNLYAQGKYYVSPIYGFTKEKGRDKPLVINEEEAKIVRLCYAMTAEGYSFSKIADALNTLGVKGRRNMNWSADGVKDLLSNEKYAGDLRARKTVTPNYKTHKAKKNEGEKPQYFVKEHHDPIVPQLAYDVALRIMKNRNGNVDGIPYLKAVPEGIVKGFISVNNTLRGFTLSDYEEASHSVYGDEVDNSEISIFADKASIFDLRNYDTVSGLLFDEHLKPSCSIKNNKVSFNKACCQALGAENAEILFHPSKAILAVRTPVQEENRHAVQITKPVYLSQFLPVAMESAGLTAGHLYRLFGTKRAKNGECIMFFDLREAQIITKENDGFILPNKYTDRYGDGFYENLTACNLHKIDIEGLWQALQESKPADSLAGHIVELTEFRQKSLAEFDLL